MRLPVRKGESITVDSGVSIAMEFHWGFPKLIVYSQTLSENWFQTNPQDSIAVLRMPVDLYAKSTGSDDDSREKSIEVLKVKSWADRVIDSITCDGVHIELNSSVMREPPVTTTGAFLTCGTNRLPPILANQIQDLANNWCSRTNDRVDAAIRFIEATARLAVAQTSVLCMQRGEVVKPPTDDSIFACLRHLENNRDRVYGWDWYNYLSKEALASFQQARMERNQKSHNLTINDSQKHWAELRSPLRFAMDVAAYWIRHPIATNLVYSREGWSAELLAGNTRQRVREKLPTNFKVPTEALLPDAGAWQIVWDLSGEEPVQTPLSWGDWLTPDEQTNIHWWLRIRHGGDKDDFVDLITGQQR